MEGEKPPLIDLYRVSAMQFVRRLAFTLSVFCAAIYFLPNLPAWGYEVTIRVRTGSDNGKTAAACEPTPCNVPTGAPEPCAPMPCEGTVDCRKDASSLDFNACKDAGKASLWKSGGWYEFGIYGNSHGATFNEGGNGPMHTAGNQRTDFHLDQYYLYNEKELDTRHGWDIGGRMDLVYGVDAPGMQSTGDRSFDYGWGRNHHGYALAMYQLYGTIGYKKLQVKMGKFGTPIGWEGSASRDNFFYSHSYCYWIEPTTHVGALADYQLTDRLTLHGGWVAGENNGFKNHYHDKSFLGGFTWELTDKATIHYWLTVGKTNNRFRLGDWRFDDDGFLARQNHFVQSLCFEWMPTERFTYVLQYNLRNDTDVRRQDYRSVGHYSSYGINQHFLYKLSDSFSTGLRVEWLRDNGGFGYITEDPANYFQLTLGLNWFWSERCCLRPEIRYDSVLDGTARPYGNGQKSDQVTGGIGFLVGY